MLNQILSSLEGLTDAERATVLQTLMSSDSRLSKVKALLGIQTEDHDAILEYVIQTVEKMVLRYINWDTLPEDLENVLVVMCVSYYKSAGLGNSSPRVPDRLDRRTPSTWEPITANSSGGRLS